MITTITLSTGTQVHIPVFSAVPASQTGYSIVTRGYGVLRDYGHTASGGQLLYSALTDNEALELGNIMFGVDAQGVQFSAAPQHSPGHAVCILAWIYDGTQYRTNTCINYNASIDSIVYGFLDYGDSASNRYYTGVNIYNENYLTFPYTQFYEIPDSAAGTAVNIRPGSPYSIDIRTNGFYQYALTLDTSGTSLTEVQLKTNIDAYMESHPDSGVDYDESDNPFVNPYGVTISQPGGGDGDIDIDPDAVDKAEIPDLPTISAVDAGLITMYNCTAGQLQVLGNYLWSNIYDLETNFTKLFASPMEAIIGLSIIPVTPTLGGASTVKFGNIDTHISMSKLSSQFVEKDMGSISVKKWIGSFMDYSPYVKLSLYLPYIGYRELSPDDVVGDTIHVVYHIDCLSGGCCAMVETGKKGLLYSFDGSCIANVPITALNYSGAIQNAISAVSGGVSTVAGLATGNPVAAVGGAASVAQNVTNIKPSIQRSGQMSGAAGLMSYQSPMLIIERPNMCVPENLNTYTGNMLYVSRKLSQCKGFTQVSLIHLDGIPCTEKERDELMSLLNKGVIF